MGASKESARGEAFAAILYAEPGALGVIANIMSALVVAIENMLNGSSTTVALTLAGVHLIFIGGFLQLMAAFMSFRRNDHLTATAFVVFSSIWSIYGIGHILQPVLGAEVMQRGLLPGMVAFSAIAIVLCLCALTVNYILPPVLLALFLTLVFEAVGLFYLWGKRVAAAFELFIVITGLYAVIVMTLKGVSQRYVLPGFGNAPYNVLLIRTKAQDNKKNEKKKNTKYAEPMALGYLGNVVPATVLAFHHLGYFTDFRPAASMLLFSLLCHMLASFYAFLRHDFFHSVQFICYLMLWMSKGITQTLISLEFHGIIEARVNFYGQWGLILVYFALLVGSMCQGKVVFLYNLLFLVMLLLSVAHIPINVYNFTFGVPCAIIALVSLYIALATMVNSIAEKTVLYTGTEVVTQISLRAYFERVTACCRSQKFSEMKEIEEGPEMDGYIVDTISFLGNTVAAICMSTFEATNGTEALPWVIVAGALLQLYSARLSYASGSLAKTYVTVVLTAYWIMWAIILINGTLSPSLRAGSVAVLCLHTVAMMVTLVLRKVWVPVSVLFELNVICLVLKCFDVLPRYMLLVSMLLLGLVCFYGVFAGMVNGVLGGPIIPMGEPIIQPREKEFDDLASNRAKCPAYPSRRTTSLKAICRLLDDGGVCGVPTDTVYALAASCKHPASIKNIYHIKGRPSEKPICVCLSNLDQLEDAQPGFSPLLWAFMRRCYPGGISCVVPKGQWLRNMGLDDAVEYIGTKESVCIRVPDSTVLSHLVLMTGPVALTSANPSGAPDSTHHDMVIDSLGHKISGMLCDGESNELVASTVVNCMKIDQGEITFFRIGCTPKEIVERHFEAAKEEIKNRTTAVNLDRGTENFTMY